LPELVIRRDTASQKRQDAQNRLKNNQSITVGRGGNNLVPLMSGQGKEFLE
jgi:hypothetical protein